MSNATLYYTDLVSLESRRQRAEAIKFAVGALCFAFAFVVLGVVRTW